MVRFLVVEDDIGSRLLMQKLLADYGEVSVAVDGEDAVSAFSAAMEEGRPFGVVFLDIMMPKMDGLEALGEIRRLEAGAGGPQEGAIVIMATVLEDPRSVVDAYFEGGADAYMVKPVDRQKIASELERLGIRSMAKGLGR